MRSRPAFLAVLAALCLAACGDDGAGDQAKNAEAREGSTSSKQEIPRFKPFPLGKPVDLPEGAVAMVGDEVITRKDHEQVKDAFARDGFRGRMSNGRFTRNCETFYLNLFLPPQKRNDPYDNEPSHAECGRRYKRIKQIESDDRAMQLLIQTAWMEREAKEYGVTATLDEARRKMREVLRPSYPTPAYYRSLMQSLRPYEKRFALAQFRMGLQMMKVVEKRRRAQPPLGQRDVMRYYRRNTKQYLIPERRTVAYVRVDKQGDAEKAERAIRSGKSFKAMGRRFSSVLGPDCCSISITADEASASIDDSQTFQEAAMAAQKGRLMGPLGTATGWYVFKVVDITPEGKQPVATVRPAILATLRSQREAALQPKFVKHMYGDYRKITKCTPKLTVPMCSNGTDPGLPKVP